MLAVKASHNLNYRTFDPNDDHYLMHVKTLFQISRHNFLTPAIIRSIIPSDIPFHSPEYVRRYDWISDRVESCYLHTLSFVNSAVEQIVEAVDKHCGPSFFKYRERKERYALFSAVFKQYPAWTMSKFKSLENDVVDFREIFRKAIRRRDLVEKSKWRRFFHYEFVLLCEKVYQWKMDQEVEGEIRETWNWIGKRERSRALNLGGAFDLPARPSWWKRL